MKPQPEASRQEVLAGLVERLTPEPEGGARCVSGARRDLCGGRGEILVPTATMARLSGRGVIAFSDGNRFPLFLKMPGSILSQF